MVLMGDTPINGAETLADKFFHVSPETFIVGSLVSFTVMIRAIIFRSGNCSVMLDRLRAHYLRLVLDGTEDFVDGEPRRGEVMFRSEDSE